ncbi:hypothetical protein GCM10011575_01650 [Microlunatus endophyticus]|uniref:HTH marR-type domain-containing protein n=1 Tax=Microlunatus endophyticus TaxID=1716077 RepID=A0A917W0M1_9ACTN|nr:MarR family transcriptional regulator [Microlunatus endophyticus]GGL47472.1 hypothetical protein GCM10011575_01650 [Microlunatus endophyticus]
MTDGASRPKQRQRLLAGLTAFGSAQNELLRLFARSNRMHLSDAAAVVQIIEHEDQGRLLTPARLAERIGLSPGATSILLSRLETGGFIQRTREHADRRVVTLRSTTSINDAADAFFEPLAQQLDEALAALDGDEIDTLERTIGLLRSVLESYVHAAAQEIEPD